MKNILPFFLLVSVLTFGQNTTDNFLKVEYTHSTHIEGLPSETTVKSYLLCNSINSLYEMDYMRIDENRIDEEDSDAGITLSIKPTRNPKIYRELKNQTIYSIERIGMKPFLVKDSDSIFKWKLQDEFKEVIGYRCQKATAEHRGRNYIAFFTTEIPFVVGPWKFSNLPGLILEVYSTDKVFKIKANKLQIKNKTLTIENPFKDKIEKSLSWSQFVLEYKKKYNQLKYYRSPDGGTSSIPKKAIETYIED